MSIILSGEKWAVDDRGPFRCVRDGYSIVTLEKREYVGNIRTEEYAEYIVKIHNQYIEEHGEEEV